MGLFRDSRDRRDLSLKVCWTLAVWLMTQQLRCDVNEADEAEQRRLERHPELGHARAVLPRFNDGDGNISQRVNISQRDGRAHHVHGRCERVGVRRRM